MGRLFLATIVFAVPAATLAAAPTCAVLPSAQEAAGTHLAQTQSEPSLSLPSAVTPLRQAAHAAPTLSAAAVAAAASHPAVDPVAPPPPATSAPILTPLSAQAIAAVPALKRLASAGAALLDLGTVHGMRTIFAKKDEAFQVFYLVPDGSAAIGGIMWDASGHDITRDQVTPIPGVIPTVRIGPGTGLAEAAPAVDHEGADALRLVQKTAYGTIGSPDAPRLWMFVDPLCSFSIRAMQQLAPYVQAGTVRLSVIPLSVLDYEDEGRSTPAARIMVGEPKDQMVADWVRGRLTGTPPADATAVLDRNMAVAAALQVRGTPTMIWKSADGSAERSDGIPLDLNAVIASIGH
jgi:thiol:disulfide interchange protein DsbG